MNVERIQCIVGCSAHMHYDTIECAWPIWLTEIGCEGVEWVFCAHDMVCWWAVLLCSRYGLSVGCFVVVMIWFVGGLFCCAHDMVCRWAVLLCSRYGLSVGCFVVLTIWSVSRLFFVLTIWSASRLFFVLTIWSVGGLLCCSHDMVCQ
jgi:hypothetical protein